MKKVSVMDKQLYCIIQTRTVYSSIVFFTSRKRHTRSSTVSWARRWRYETAVSMLGRSRGTTIPVKLLNFFIYNSSIISRTSIQCPFTAAAAAIIGLTKCCLLYSSDAADDPPCVDLGCRRIIKKKKNNNTT